MEITTDLQLCPIYLIHSLDLLCNKGQNLLKNWLENIFNLISITSAVLANSLKLGEVKVAISDTTHREVFWNGDLQYRLAVQLQRVERTFDR